MFTQQTVNKALVPSNATSDLSVIQNYSLKDKQSNDWLLYINNIR